MRPILAPTALLAVLAALPAAMLTPPAAADGYRSGLQAAAKWSKSSRLSWAPPRLENPVTVRVTNWNRSLNLDPARDYVVQMPSTALTASGGLVIQGGRSLVLVGGQITIPWQGESPTIESRRGLYLKGQTGTVHVEGLLIDGPDLSEGINLDQRLGATVQLQNVRVENVHARDEVGFTDNHPDVLQTWSGPAELRVDRLSGTTRYQGFFLHPTQFGGLPPPRVFDLRRVDVTGIAVARYLLWQATPFPLALRDVWVDPAPGRTLAQTLWPDPSAWPGVFATETGVPHVPAGSVGIGYRSPGYR